MSRRTTRGAVRLAALAALAAPACFAGEPAPGELSLSQARERLTERVAREWKVASEDVEVVEAEPRTWPDASLGCPGRRRLMGRAPVSGYRFVLTVGEHRLVYHADVHGRMLRCDRPGKPLGPIAR